MIVAKPTTPSTGCSSRPGQFTIRRIPSRPMETRVIAAVRRARRMCSAVSIGSGLPRSAIPKELGSRKGFLEVLKLLWPCGEVVRTAGIEAPPERALSELESGGDGRVARPRPAIVNLGAAQPTGQ